MPNLVETAHPLPQACGDHLFGFPFEIDAQTLGSAGPLGGELIQDVSNVPRARRADPEHGNDVSSVRLLARLATSFLSWPSGLRIDLIDGRATQTIGASGAKNVVNVHVRGDRCFSKNPESTRENNPGKDFTNCLLGLLAEHEKRQVLGLSDTDQLPTDKVLDEKLRLLLGEQLHHLLQSDSDISQWARSDGSRSLAKQTVIDLGLILSTFAAITGVSWAGSPTIADIQVPGLPVTSTGGGPLAALLLAGSVTLGVLAKLYQAQHRQPIDANAALIELLFGDRLNEKQRGILLEKAGPHMASLTPALLVTNVYKRLDSSPPAQDVETTLRRLPVTNWARAAEHNSHSFDPRSIGRPSDMATAFESFVGALWGSQAGSEKPIAERLLNAFGLSVPVRASYPEKSLHRQLNSLENQLMESGDKNQRLELKHGILNMKHDDAMNRGASAEEIGKFQQQYERFERKDELRIHGRDAYVDGHRLHDTNSSKRGYRDSTAEVPIEPSRTSTSSLAFQSLSARKGEATASVAREYTIDGYFDIQTESIAGALTAPGEAVSSAETASLIFPGASAVALRPKPISSQATAPVTVVNVALLSGRAYQLQMRQKALEEAIPGWMLAEPAEQKKVRTSLAAYAATLPALTQLEKKVAALPNDMADYLQQHIRLYFGLDVDPRNATLHSQTWRTQENWNMGSHPVPAYHPSAPQKTDVNRTLWEVAQGNFQDDEGLSEFRRGDLSAQHLSISQGASDTTVTGRSISEWVNLIREEDLGKRAQDRLDSLLDSAKPALLGSYPLALKASLEMAKLSDFPASSAELLSKVLEKPGERPTTLSGRPWQISPLRLFGAELEAFVFHTSGFGGNGRADIHADGGVLYIPNQCLRAFSSATELGDIVEENIGTPSGRALVAERAPLDVRETFIRRAEVAAASGSLRNDQVELGQNLKGELWDAMYARDKAFRERNLKTLIRPTAEVDRESTIAQNMAIYQAAMGMISSFSGLPLVGPAFIGANLAMFANAAMEYTQLRRQEGDEAADALLPDLFTSLLSAVDFEPDVPPRAGVRGGKASTLPRYFKVPSAETMGLPPADANGLMKVNHRTYVRLDNDDIVEVDASEPARPRPVARWHEVEVHGSELLRGADGRWSPKPDDVDSLTTAELFKRMLPEVQTPWPGDRMQGLIDDLGLDQTTLRGIWDGGSPSSLLSGHMQRYQNLNDLDALPDVLSNAMSPVPQSMQPVIAQALADRTGRTLQVYVSDSNGAPLLKASYKPGATTVADTSPVKVLDRGGSEYVPLHASPSNQNVPNRLSLIDAVIDAVPTFAVNESLPGANQKPVRRGQAVTEVINHIKQERAAFQNICLQEVSTGAAPLDASTGRPAQVLRVFPSVPSDLLQRVSAELDGDGAASGPLDSGKAGSIVADHHAEAMRHEVLFRLQRGPHTKHSEAAYLNILVSDPAWPKGLTVEVTPVAISTIDGSLWPKKNKALVYGDASTESRRLQLYRRADGTYAAIASDGRERGSVPRFADHAPDDLGRAVLQAMTSGERDAWTSAHAPSDVNTWVAARARGLDSGTLDARMGHESTALKRAMLSDITPDSTSLHNLPMRQDGTYEVDGKIYLHAHGLTYRLKEDSDRAGRYRVISSGSSESLSPSSSYAGLDFAPSIVRDRQGVWSLDTKDRLWSFHKLGSITQGVDVTQARAVLDITDISAKQLKDIQLGKKTPSPELGDAITRARMRSVIARLSRDDGHFNDLQDPTPVLAMLTKLDGWPKDTAIEVSDEDGQVTSYGQPGTTKAVRVALDDLQSPILESLGDLFGTAFLGSIVEGQPTSPTLLDKLGKQLSKMAGLYPSTLLDIWYFRREEPESMLVQMLMSQEPGLTRPAAEQILIDVGITRKADLMPNGRLAGNVKRLSLEASQATRAQRLAEAVRTGRVVAASEKAIVVELLSRLRGWDVDLVINAHGDMTLYQGDGVRLIRGDGDGYQVLDSNARVLSKAHDIYAGIGFALAPADSAKLGLDPTEDNALQAAVWKQSEQDKTIFQRPREATDEADRAEPVLCRVRRGLVSGGCVSSAAATVPQAANDAKSAIVAVHASVDRTSRRSSSTSSSASGSSVRSQNLGNSNIAAIVVSTDIKDSRRRDKVTFPKIDETNLAIQKRALVSRSSGSKDSSNYLIFASAYNDANLPQIDPQKTPFEEVARHNTNGGVSVPGRHFKYQVQVARGGKLALNRPSDTEAALLEYVVERIKAYVGASSVLPNPHLSGKLVIYTELTPCDSCQNIIRQFERDYPNIALEVYFSFKGAPERSATALVDADVHLWKQT